MAQIKNIFIKQTESNRLKPYKIYIYLEKHSQTYSIYSYLVDEFLLSIYKIFQWRVVLRILLEKIIAKEKWISKSTQSCCKNSLKKAFKKINTLSENMIY